MKFGYFTPAYFISLGVTVLFVTALYFAFFKCKKGVQKGVVLTLMLLNVAQHLLKSFVWPHLYGRGFAYENTAYNVCAALILLSPFVFLFGKGGMKDFMVLVGTGGPLLALVVPFWFEGKDWLSWEFLRFFVCHVLLVATSLLPALWGLHKLSYRNFWKIPLNFFGVLILIMFNIVVCVCLGLYGNGTEKLFDVLYAANPCWMMHPAPPAGFGWVQTVLEALSPPIFLGGNGRPYVPLLWYAVPMYLVLALAAFALTALIDRKRLAQDVKSLFRRRKKTS